MQTSSIKHNLMKRFIGTVAFLAVVMASKAQDPQGFSLKQAQDFAVQNNYDVSKSKADIEISRKKVWEVTSLGLPQITGEGSFQHFLDIPTQVIPAAAFQPGAPEDEFIGVQFGTDYNASGTLQATQLIFDGSYLVGLKAAKAYTGLSEKMLQKTEIDIKNEVANAYYLALVAQENKSVLDSTHARMKKLLADMTEVFNNGLAEEQDVDQLKLTVLGIENSVKNAERQLEVAQNLLKLLMGYDIAKPIALTENLDDLVGTSADEGLVAKQFSASQHIDYQLVQTQEALSQLNLQNVKADGYPQLAGFFSHSQNAFRTSFDFFDGDQPWYPATLWGLSLKVPIYGFGRQNARVAQARLELEKNQTTLTQVDQGLQLQAMQAKANYSTNWEILQNQKDNLELAESIQTKTLIKYKEGIATSMELSQAQSQYLNTQGQYIGAMLNFLQAKAELKKMMGTP